MNPLLILGAVCAFLLAGVVGEGFVIHGKNAEITAKDQQIDGMTGQRNAQAAGLATCDAAKTRQQAEIDAGDARGRATALRQQSDAQQLATVNASLQADNDNLFQQLEEAINARPVTVNVSRVYPTGWDPLVASAADYLRRLQLGRTANYPDPALGGISSPLPAGGPGAAGTTPGTGLAVIADNGAPEGRPDAQQQTVVIGYIGQLYRWGDACYRDKAAIAASQQAGPVTP